MSTYMQIDKAPEDGTQVYMAQPLGFASPNRTFCCALKKGLVLRSSLHQLLTLTAALPSFEVVDDASEWRVRIFMRLPTGRFICTRKYKIQPFKFCKQKVECRRDLPNQDYDASALNTIVP